jgi:hypothetical protein
MADAHPRAWAKRPLSRLPRHCRPLVRAAHRPRDGRLQHRHERGVHAGVSACWGRGAAIGMSIRLDVAGRSTSSCLLHSRAWSAARKAAGAGDRR